MDQKTGGPVFKPAFKYWTENTNRHIYRRVVFSSKTQSADTYNLFRGLGVKPRKGTCLRILNHLKEVICSGNADDYQELLKLIAWQLQNIGQPSRIIVILLTEKQQAGKGFLIENILLKIYGPSGFNATTAD